jgi:hypothetical protein
MAPRVPREIAELMDALQLKGATTQPLRELTAGEWETLLTFSELAHLTPHQNRSKRPPARAGIGEAPLRYPADETDFLLNFLPVVVRQVRRDGIHW